MHFPLGQRALHWGLALAIVANWWVLEEGEDPHNWVGYLAALFVIIRIFWGIFDTRPALALKRILEKGVLPALAYGVIWGHVVALAVTGFLMGTDRFWGEEWLQELHEGFSTSLQVLVIIHLSGVFLDSIRFRRKTWMRMITGAK